MAPEVAASDICGRPPCRAGRRRLLSVAIAAAVAGAAARVLLPFDALGPAVAGILGGGTDEDDRAAQAVEHAKQMLLEADAVFFDVDSTVVTTEGINLLGKCYGVMDEIAELTNKAMNGNVKFQAAMAQRLQLLADNGMTQESLERCVRTEGRPRWSPGIQQVVRRLQGMGKDVYLVSGGFRNMLMPIAEALNIPDEMVYGNTILFDEDGNYKGFDRRAPTSRSGGKPAVLRAMRRAKGYRTMVMLGDGATDLDARTKGPAKAFIGYGGVAVREKVKDGADWYIHSFKEILDILPKVEV